MIVLNPVRPPPLHCDNARCPEEFCLRGVLILLPIRKNSQAKPTWVPVAERRALRMLHEHVSWLRRVSPSAVHLFPARRRVSTRGQVSFTVNRRANSVMSVKSFRQLTRRALQEACGLSKEQAAMFGTHSARIGAIEALRAKGVPAELRQQLGGWLSSAAALGYLQLTPAAQFNLLEGI